MNSRNFKAPARWEPCSLWHLQVQVLSILQWIDVCSWSWVCFIFNWKTRVLRLSRPSDSGWTFREQTHLNFLESRVSVIKSPLMDASHKKWSHRTSNGFQEGFNKSIACSILKCRWVILFRGLEISEQWHQFVPQFEHLANLPELRWQYGPSSQDDRCSFTQTLMTNSQFQWPNLISPWSPSRCHFWTLSPEFGDLN